MSWRVATSPRRSTSTPYSSSGSRGVASTARAPFTANWAARVSNRAYCATTAKVLTSQDVGAESEWIHFSACARASEEGDTSTADITADARLSEWSGKASTSVAHGRRTGLVKNQRATSGAHRAGCRRQTSSTDSTSPLCARPSASAVGCPWGRGRGRRRKGPPSTWRLSSSPVPARAGPVTPRGGRSPGRRWKSGCGGSPGRGAGPGRTSGSRTVCPPRRPSW